MLGLGLGFRVGYDLESSNFQNILSKLGQAVHTTLKGRGLNRSLLEYHLSFERFICLPRTLSMLFDGIGHQHQHHNTNTNTIHLSGNNVLTTIFPLNDYISIIYQVYRLLFFERRNRASPPLTTLVT